MSNALNTVQKFFPGVTEVADATAPAKIEVTAADGTKKGRKNHAECALAVACKKKFNLDGVIISRTMAYLVKGKKARRFQLPQGTAREVVSFDRGAGFAPGTYLLSAISGTNRLGQVSGGHSREKGDGRPKQFRHITANIRTVLGGQDPD